jgi:CubicO group peptidase (beta-lactamase class C family)
MRAFGGKVWRVIVVAVAMWAHMKAIASDAPAAHTLTAIDAEAWLDGYMPSALASADIPGAVVVVVKDGGVLLSKGYGVADVARQTPVDPRATLFRVGSISKLFTWTAVMQLVEQQRIDLDADINRYLDFAVPPFAGRPVTLRQLMTHRAGFEEARRGIATQDPQRRVPLGETMRRDMPVRVYTPGTTPGYSNYGAALAGYIVQRVSGESFDDYIARHILLPLGMQHSTFKQPLPPALAPWMAAGYTDIHSPPSPFELVVWAPAGGLSATGADMARFMLAHLQQGTLGEARILSEATAHAMHETPTTTIPVLNRMMLGFFERNINGRRAIGHDGDTVLFHSTMVLYPDDGIGIFAAFNSGGIHNAVMQEREQLFERFSDRYLPATVSTGGPTYPLATTRAHARMFSSAYWSSRSYSTSFMAATKLLFPVRVVVNPDDSASLSGLRGADGELKRFREVAPFVWHEIGGHDRLAAIVSQGHIVRLSVNGQAPATVFDAVPGWESPTWVLPAFLGGILVLAAWLLLWPISAWRHRRLPALTRSRARVWAEQAMRLTAALALAAVAGWVYIMSRISNPVGIYQLADQDTVIFLSEGLTLVGFTGALAAAAVRTALIWRERSWSALVAAVVLFVGTAAMTYTAWIYRLMRFSVAF